MLRIELDDHSRPSVAALLAEHLRNIYELSPPGQVFAFDASKLKAPDITMERQIAVGLRSPQRALIDSGRDQVHAHPSAWRRRGRVEHF